MQPSSSPLSTLISNSELVAALTKSSELKTLFDQLGKMMQIAPSPIGGGQSRNESDIKSLDKSLNLLIKPRLNIGASQLISLTKLSLTSLLSVMETPQLKSLQQRFPAMSTNAKQTVLALIKQTPATAVVKVPVNDLETLITELAQAHPKPITLAASVRKTTTDTIEIKPHSAKIPAIKIPESLRVQSTVQQQVPKWLSKQPIDVNVTISSKQQQWVIDLKPIQKSTAPNNVPSQASRATIPPSPDEPHSQAEPIKLPVSVKEVLRLVNNIQLPIETKRTQNALNTWSKELLSVETNRALEPMSRIAVQMLTVKGNELTIKGITTQLIGIAPVIEPSLAKEIPLLTKEGLSHFKLRASHDTPLPEVTITKVVPNPAPQRNKAESTQPSTTRNSETISATSQDVTPIKAKLDQLTPETKAALQRFIEITQRLNLVNFAENKPNVRQLVESLTPLAAKAPLIANAIKQLEPIKMATDERIEGEKIAQTMSSPHKNSQESQSLTQSQNTQLPTHTTLKQLFTSPTWLQTGSSMTATTPATGFVGGLIQLLQLSLVSRQLKNLPNIEELLPSSQEKGKHSASKPAQLSRSQLRDFAQNDNQFEVLKQLKAMIAGHQHAKLKNLESALQGQESFYYILPGFANEQKATELLIKREPDKHNSNQEGAQNSCWQLTMKLNAGNAGELLTKVKVNGEKINLHIYTSSQSLLETVLGTAPFLIKRLKLLGLEVESHEIQLGKIPPTLSDSPYQIVETRV